MKEIQNKDGSITFVLEPDPVSLKSARWKMRHRHMNTVLAVAALVLAAAGVFIGS